jgi:hypothetical protein
MIYIACCSEEELYASAIVMVASKRKRKYQIQAVTTQAELSVGNT